MKIKEVENLLSVSRSNIRFYEKEGLLTPARKENNYRDYSEQDIAALKKILALRKLGFTVEEILSMKRGELFLTDAAYRNIGRLEENIDSLKGALEITKFISKEKLSFETLDQERLWNEIKNSERNGKSFAVICKDYIVFERDMFDNMWKYVFLHDFKKSRKKYGMLAACGILLLICLARGLSNAVIWHESFWQGFLYPLMVFVIGSIIILPLYLLSKKFPKIVSVVCSVLLALAGIFLVFWVLIILYGIIRAIF